MAECHHTWTQGREGEKGSWCNACGAKVYEVETRTCDGCDHYRDVIHGAVCKKHLMAVSPGMLVTFKIANGTCWQDKRHNAALRGAEPASSAERPLEGTVMQQQEVK